MKSLLKLTRRSVLASVAATSVMLSGGMAMAMEK